MTAPPSQGAAPSFFPAFGKINNGTAATPFQPFAPRQYPQSDTSSSNSGTGQPISFLAPPTPACSSSKFTATSTSINDNSVPGAMGGSGGRKRAASPIGTSLTSDEPAYFAGAHDNKKRRPNLAHGFSGLSISPETRKQPSAPLFGMGPSVDGIHDYEYAAPGGDVHGHAAQRQEDEVVDDDDGLLPHERDLVIEELADQDPSSASSSFKSTHRTHLHAPHRHRPKAPHRQFSASKPTSAASLFGSSYPNGSTNGKPNGMGRPYPYSRMDSSSSASEGSGDEDDLEPAVSASASPYMSRRPTIQADEVELPDTDTFRYSDPTYAGQGRDDVQVEELAPAPDPATPHPNGQFNFSYPYRPSRPSRSRRGVKRRTSSVSEGDARQKKSKGMEVEDAGAGVNGDLDMDMDMDTDGDAITSRTGREGRPIRGRERGRGRTRYYEPEKDRIIYTSLSSSPSRSRSRSRSQSRSRSRSGSPPIELSTADLSHLEDARERLSQPGQQGFTISPSVLTRLLAAQRDAQARGGRSNTTYNVNINGHSFPFDPTVLTPDIMKGMNERGLVLYRPLGIPPGVSRYKGGGGAGAGAQGQAGEGGAGVGEWEETVRRWAQGQKVPLAQQAQGADEGRFEEIGEDEDGDVGMGMGAEMGTDAEIMGAQEQEHGTGQGYPSGPQAVGGHGGDEDVEME